MTHPYMFLDAVLCDKKREEEKSRQTEHMVTLNVTDRDGGLNELFAQSVKINL